MTHSLNRPWICILLLVATPVAAGCIDQAGEDTNQDSQGLTVISEPNLTLDFSFADTFAEADFANLDSLVQFDVAGPPIEVVTVTASRLPTDSAIEALHLSNTIADLAYSLKDRHPTIKFNSGRRDLGKQARAMAKNVVKNRQFIVKTYRDTALRAALQKWVDDHPNATEAEIAAGLLSVFDEALPDEVASFSLHLSGDAFDVQPVNGAEGNAIHSDLAHLPGRFIDNEGGLRRWHYQRR